MRFSPTMDRMVKSGTFIGDKAPNGRVTVEPNWRLKYAGPNPAEPTPIYGNSERGPYRYYQDVASSGVQYEIPNIQTISWNRSASSDIATCTITLYNIWHDGNEQTPELEQQLGRPGYFWPKRGAENNIWLQTESKGAFKKDGTWEPQFSWTDVLVPNALIRTFQGYGGFHTNTAGTWTFRSIDTCLTAEELFPTGVWIVDTVTATSAGTITLTMKDIGRILLDQIIFPPLVPPALYPLSYYPEGKTPFDSMWGPRSRGGQNVASRGEVRLKRDLTSADLGASDTAIAGHRPSHAVDGNWSTFAWSSGHSGPTSATNPEFFQYEFTGKLGSIGLKPWAGGYTCYISVAIGGTWQTNGESGGTVPGSGINYVKKIFIPMNLPDNSEPVLNIDLREGFDNVTDPQTGISTRFPKQWDAGNSWAKLRLSFENLYYSGYTSGSGHYRSGIRDLIGYRTGLHVGPYSPDYAAQPWTFAMCSHPVRGYWVIDSNGHVHGFGDAADYDSTGFGAVTGFGSNNLGQPYKAVAITAHPDGKGVWVLDESGRVVNKGVRGDGSSLPHYGNHIRGDIYFSPDFWVAPINRAIDITATHTGNGYWVLYTDGTYRGFGDANPSSGTLPTTAVTASMASIHNGKKPGYTVDQYIRSVKGRGIVAHPSMMGFYTVNDGGEVYCVGSEQPPHHGGLLNRVYNRNMADTFKLGEGESATGIEVTKTGNGYWVTFGSGKVAAFGDAKGQGPTDIYAGNPMTTIPATPQNIEFQDIFRALAWSVARDPDGNGFWILTANGSVHSYNAEFWGQPGFHGMTGYRWHEGNFDGEYSSIIRELLLWSGFTFYDPTLASNQPPAVYGNLESTGIQTDTIITGDKFDKKTVMDVIKELASVVAYDFYIDEEGAARFESGNIWRAGNFDQFGAPIYVTYDEDWVPTRVAPDASGAQPYIPIIDEMTDMFDYSATLNFEPLRSEIIIGNELPNPKDGTQTRFVKKYPFGATGPYNQVPALRGIVKPAIWSSQTFDSQEEMRLMAELINIRMWFAERSGSLNCVANPLLSVNDQVRIVERNTNETFIHLITGIDSSYDANAQTWSYSLTTHWLGDANNWVISAADIDAPYEYIKVSERVDRWQNLTGRQLPTGGGSTGGLANVVEFSGEFWRSIAGIPYEVTFGVEEEVDPAYPVPDPGIGGISGGDDFWVYTGNLKVNTATVNARLTTEMLSPPLGSPISDAVHIQLFNPGTETVFFDSRLAVPGQSIALPNLGSAGTETVYPFMVSGPPKIPGNGALKLTFSSGNTNSASASGTILVLGGGG